MVKTLLFVLAMAAPVAAFAQDHSKHKGMKHGPRPNLGASAAFDADGTLWAVRKDGDHVVLHRSADNGKTWDAGTKVNAAAEEVLADGDGRPRVALGAKGAVYVTWTQPMPAPYTGNVRFARSTDGGRTFGAPVTVHTDRQQITHRFDALTVTRDGKVFIAWIDKRDQVAAGKDYRGAALYFAVSDDGGATFRNGDFRAAHNSCECCRISLLPQADGTVLAMWRHVFEPNIRDHAIIRLHPDGKASGMRRATFDDWKMDACPHHGPSLAQDDTGRLHAVWYSGTPGKEGVYYGVLREGSVANQRRIGGDTAAHADIAINGKRVAIVWKEFDGKVSKLRALRSDDAGGTFREVDLGTADGPNDQPKVVTRGNAFHVVWNTAAQPLRTVALPEGAATTAAAASTPLGFTTESLKKIRAEHAGKPFVLSFWSVTCAPCALEMAVWKAMRQKHPEVPILIVSTDGPGERDRMAQFLRRYDPGPVQRWWYEDEFEERVRFAVDPKWRGELPRTYLYDAQHKVEVLTGLDEPAVERWFAKVARK